MRIPEAIHTGQICDDPAEKRENTIRLIWWEVPLSSIVQPTESQLDSLVEPYLVRQQLRLGFAIGYASLQFTPPGQYSPATGGVIAPNCPPHSGIRTHTLFPTRKVTE